MKTSKQTISVMWAKKKASKIAMVSLLVSIASITGCSSTQGSHSMGSGIIHSAVLGAASGAITQVNGNSDDVKNAAGVGALLGILGGVAR